MFKKQNETVLPSLPIMSGREGKHLRFDEEVEEDEKALGPRSWSDLPPELLELIASSGLTLYDKSRASLVCKTWHSAMRVVNRFPWIFYYPKQGSNSDRCAFLDPSGPINYSIDMPELRGTIPCYTKDGWLLLYRPSTRGVFFFNPFTRKSIKLPELDRTDEAFAFSCAPTSPGCVVFIAKRIAGDHNSIEISTCHPGATEWATSIHPTKPLFHCAGCPNKVVFCNGLFYSICLHAAQVGIFDPRGRKWTHHHCKMFDARWENSHLLNSLWIEPPQYLPPFLDRLNKRRRN